MVDKSIKKLDSSLVLRNFVAGGKAVRRQQIEECPQWEQAEGFGKI